MRRFIFKLEGVLEQRRHAEAQRQRQLALAQKQIMSLQQAINDAAVAEKSASVPLRGRIDPRTLATHVRFSQVMRRKLASLGQQLDAARSDLAVAHAALVEAAKQRKVLEKLEEKQKARWIEQQHKLESAAHDDVAQRMSHDHDPAASFPGGGP